MFSRPGRKSTISVWASGRRGWVGESRLSGGRAALPRRARAAGAGCGRGLRARARAPAAGAGAGCGRGRRLRAAGAIRSGALHAFALHPTSQPLRCLPRVDDSPVPVGRISHARRQSHEDCVIQPFRTAQSPKRPENGRAWEVRRNQNSANRTIASSWFAPGRLAADQIGVNRTIRPFPIYVRAVDATDTNPHPAFRSRSPQSAPAPAPAPAEPPPPPTPA